MAKLVVVPVDSVNPLGERDVRGQIFVIELSEDHTILVNKEVNIFYDHILSLYGVPEGSLWSSLWL